MSFINEIRLQDLNLFSRVSSVAIGTMVQFYEKSEETPAVGLRCQTQDVGQRVRGVVALDGPNAGVFYTDGDLGDCPVLVIDQLVSITVREPAPRMAGFQPPECGELYNVNENAGEDAFAVAVYWEGSFYSWLMVSGTQKGNIQRVSSASQRLGKVGTLPNDAAVQVTRES